MIYESVHPDRKSAEDAANAFVRVLGILDCELINPPWFIKSATSDRVCMQIGFTPKVKINIEDKISDTRKEFERIFFGGITSHQRAGESYKSADAQRAWGIWQDCQKYNDGLGEDKKHHDKHTNNEKSSLKYERESRN